MVILGIDPALSITGYGLLEDKNSGLSLVKSGVIITSSKNNYSLRLNQIYSRLLKLINQFRPQAIAVEKPYVHFRHPTTAYILGHLKGIICLLSAQKDVPLFEYAPTRIKKSILGRGQASKHQIQRMIMTLLNLRQVPRYTDITDALAVAVAHSYITKSQNVILRAKEMVF